MDKSEDVTALYEQIGRLQMDIAFLKKSYDQTPERAAENGRKRRK
ncbi:MAG: hypothetical protein U0V04_18860 [Spirosomataceae bacterium]